MLPNFYVSLALPGETNRSHCSQAMICDCLLKGTYYAEGVLGVSEIFRCGSGMSNQHPHNAVEGTEQNSEQHVAKQ